MDSLKKGVIVFFVLVVFIVAVFFYLGRLGSDDSGVGEKNSFSGDDGGGEEGVGSGGSGGSGGGGLGGSVGASGGGGAGAGSSAAGVGASGEEIAEEDSGNESETGGVQGGYCSLVRPGNLPGVDCLVNYISNDELSVKILSGNEDIEGLRVSVSECSGEITAPVEEGGTDFVFPCGISGVSFEGEIYVVYLMSDSSEIEIFGILGGSVS